MPRRRPEPAPTTAPAPPPEPAPEPATAPSAEMPKQQRGRPREEDFELPEGLAVRDMTPEQKYYHARNLSRARSRRSNDRAKTDPQRLARQRERNACWRANNPDKVKESSAKSRHARKQRRLAEKAEEAAAATATAMEVDEAPTPAAPVPQQPLDAIDDIRQAMEASMQQAMQQALQQAMQALQGSSLPHKLRGRRSKQ